jgi:hypothetical protein
LLRLTALAALAVRWRLDHGRLATAIRLEKPPTSGAIQPVGYALA